MERINKAVVEESEIKKLFQGFQIRSLVSILWLIFLKLGLGALILILVLGSIESEYSNL